MGECTGSVFMQRVIYATDHVKLSQSAVDSWHVICLYCAYFLSETD